MKALSPREAATQLSNAINQGDLETAASMYEPGASFVVKPGVVVTGTVAIREALAGFIALKPTLKTEASQFIEADGVALSIARWSLRGTDPAGNP
ncbi:MAG: YybH family protein, partial [Pyrinomonadaceae bacterium]